MDMGKQNVIYPHDGILFGNKKEIPIYYNTNDSGKQCVKGKRLVTKYHMLYDSSYIKCPEHTKSS